ncbi:MAG: hypothetical protein AAF366_01850 [Pseudomonadota bacterium]
MLSAVRTFATDESGAVSADWVVLTAFLVGTGLSVLTTVRGGVTFTSTEVAEQLRGQVIQSSFESDRCPGGLDAVQQRENANAIIAQRDPVQVSAWLDTNTTSLSNDAVEAELNRLRASVGSETGVQLEGTLLAAMECAMVMRGG